MLIKAYDLDSSDSSEKFILDVWRGTLSLKARFQTRARKTIVLARLDLNGAPHTNPDGEKIECPHIHIFREGYDDKWVSTRPTCSWSGGYFQTLTDSVFSAPQVIPFHCF